MTLRCILCGHNVERDLVSHAAREYARQMGDAPNIIAAVCLDGGACIERASRLRAASTGASEGDASSPEPSQLKMPCEHPISHALIDPCPDCGHSETPA